MKVVKVRIRRGAVGESQMVYPARYKAEEVDRNGMGPLNVAQSSAYSEHIARGGREAWCIIVLEDALADEYALDADMEIITAAQADTLMEQWRVLKGDTEEVVKDPERINAILAKNATGTALTVEDVKALDVDDPTPGVNKRLTSLAERLRIP